MGKCIASRIPLNVRWVWHIFEYSELVNLWALDLQNECSFGSSQDFLHKHAVCKKGWHFDVLGIFRLYYKMVLSSDTLYLEVDSIKTFSVHTELLDGQVWLLQCAMYSLSSCH